MLRVRTLVIVLTVCALVFAAVTPAIHKPLIHELTFQGWSGKVRMYMWRDSLAMLKDHWFLGAGFGGYPTVFKSYQRTTGIEIFQYPHNILLNFWSETGLLGLGVFGWISVITVSSITSPPSRYSILDTRYFFLIALLIHGLVDVPYFKNDLALLFWLLVWLTTACQVHFSKLNQAKI